jgi:hypothetical protein
MPDTNVPTTRPPKRRTVGVRVDVDDVTADATLTASDGFASIRIGGPGGQVHITDRLEVVAALVADMHSQLTQAVEVADLAAHIEATKAGAELTASNITRGER